MSASIARSFLTHARGDARLMASTAASLPSSARPVLKGAVFDMDGTLTVPNLDFKAMYRRCGVPLSEDLLASIASMPAAEAAAANAVIEEMEEEGRRTLVLERGAKELATWLKFHGVPTALVTRNSVRTVEHLHGALWAPAGLPPFQPAISRDDEAVPPKPHPGALSAIARQWGVAPSADLLMIGDSPSNDVAFGKAAGVTTVLVDSGRRYVEGGADGGADLTVQCLAQLPRLLWERFEVPGEYGTSVPLKKYPPPPAPSTAVARAAAAGDAAALQKALETASAEEISGVAGAGNPPIVWAAESGDERCARLLLEKGGAGSATGSAAVDVNARGYLDATAVSRAARLGHVSVLDCLLQAGANPDIPNVKSQYPLHFAAFNLNPAAVDVLLKHGASTLVLDRKGRTPAEDTSSEQIRDAILAARAGAV